jgi:uncharacterized lipoprotein YddW (UPF0748 family)
LFVAAFVVSLSSSHAQSKPPVQLRALWVDAFGPGFKTPSEVNALVKYAQAIKANALFVQVGRRMDCFCNKSSVPRSADPKLAKDFDPLEDVIRKAKPLGIQVHAWIITTAAFNTIEPQFSKDHVMATHGATSGDSWLTARTDGSTRAGRDEILDLGHPAAAEYVAQFYASIVDKYDVDGIQFDRVRYPDSSDEKFWPVWGYNAVALKRFQTETNRTDVPVPTDEQWSQWRRDQVTNLVRRVYLETKARKPNVWVGAATITYNAAPRTLEAFTKTRTYAEILQDWPSWMRQGIVDLNLPMSYKRESDAQQAKDFDGWNTFAVSTKGRGEVGVSAAIYLNTIPDSLKQYTRAIKTPGVAGWAAYSYRTPSLDVLNEKKSSSQGQQQFLGTFVAKNGPFSKTVVWKKPNVDHLSGVIGRVTKNGKGVANVQLELRASNGSSLTAYSDANGYYGASRLPEGRILVAVLNRGDVVVSTDTDAIRGRVIKASDLVLPQ